MCYEKKSESNWTKNIFYLHFSVYVRAQCITIPYMVKWMNHHIFYLNHNHLTLNPDLPYVLNYAFCSIWNSRRYNVNIVLIILTIRHITSEFKWYFPSVIFTRREIDFQKKMFTVLLLTAIVVLISFVLYKSSASNERYFEERNLKHSGILSALNDLYNAFFGKFDVFENANRSYNAFPDES